MRLSSECLVVGAGVAGCAFGYLMRQAGHDVLMLELRDARTKDKLCGGILGTPSLAGLQFIYGAEALDEIGLTYVPHLRSRSFEREFVAPVRFATVERKLLDDWMHARYLDAGGALRDRVRLVGIDEERHVATCVDQRTHERLELSYGTLVGADGATSAVRRLVTGRRQRVIASCEGHVAPRSEDIIFAYRLASLGYCWYIPAGRVSNVGCISYNEDMRSCRTWLAEFCEGLGIELPALRGAPIPTGDDVLLRAGTDIWLIGDAAGLISPTDGGGIHFALRSASRLAASFDGGEPYEEAMRFSCDYMAEGAAQRDRRYLLTILSILKLGTVMA